MASPLKVFRKYQKQLIVFFGILLMVSFLITGSIATYFGRAARVGGAAGNIAIRWKFGEITDEQLWRMRLDHLRAMSFLEALTRSRKKDSRPKAPRILPADRRAMLEGITVEQVLVRTAALAKKAEELGMVISDRMIEEYLGQLCDYDVPRAQYEPLLEAATQGRMNYAQLMRQLRIELMAEQMRIMARSAVATPAPGLPILSETMATADGRMLGLMLSFYNPFSALIPPGLANAYALRVYRKAKIEHLPLLVDSYLDRVENRPSEEELQQLFEEGKNRYADPTSTEPAFRQRRKVAFEYVKADYEQFLKLQMEQVTDEQVKKYYEDNKEFYRVSETTNAKKEAAQTPKEEQGKAEKSGQNQADEGKQTGKTEAEEQDRAAKPVESPQQDGGPVEEKGNVEPSAEGSGESRQDAKGSDADAPTASTGSSDHGEEAVEDQRDDDSDGHEPADKTAAAAPEARKKAAAEPAAEQQTEPAKASGQEKPSQPPAEPKQPAKSKPAAPGSSAEKPEAAKQGAKQAKPDAPRYKPIEEVREEIRRTLAGPPARKAMQQALLDMQRKVRAYFLKHITWQQDTSKPKPEPPDFAAIAKQLHLSYEKTPLCDTTEIGKYELASIPAFDFGGERKLYATVRVDGSGDTAFLYWKTDEREAFVPELEDVRDEVVRFWQRRQAARLARKDAEAKAEEARKSGKSLKELFGDKVIETGEFSWLSPGGGNIAFGGGALTITDVPGVEMPGNEFMRTVFSLHPGQVAVATNVPQSAYYVVRMISEKVDRNLLDMLQPGRPSGTLQPPQQVLGIAMSDQQQFYRDWMEQLERQLDIHWMRDPQ